MSKIRIRPGDVLVVVDLQRDFCPKGAIAVPDCNKIIPVVQKLIDKFTTMPFWRPWMEEWEDKMSLHAPILFTQGNKEAELHPDLIIDFTVMPVFVKGLSSHQDAYSAFDSDGLMMDLETKMPYNDVIFTLENWLNFCRAKRIFVVGLATEYSVKATVLDGLKRGFKVVVATDAVAAVNPQDGEAALKEMITAGAKLCTASKDIDHRIEIFF